MDELVQVIKDALANNQLFNTGIVLGILTWAGFLLKKIPATILDRVIRMFTYSVYFDNTTPMYNAFSDWYFANYPNKFKNVELLAEKSDDGLFIRTRQYKDFNWLIFSNRLLFITKEKKPLEQAYSLKSREIYTISGVLAKKAICKLILEATQ